MTPHFLYCLDEMLQLCDQQDFASLSVANNKSQGANIWLAAWGREDIGFLSPRK